MQIAAEMRATQAAIAHLTAGRDGWKRRSRGVTWMRCQVRCKQAALTGDSDSREKQFKLYTHNSRGPRKSRLRVTPTNRAAAAQRRPPPPFRELRRSSHRTAALKGKRDTCNHPEAPHLPMRALFIIDIRSRELHPSTAVWGEQVILPH